MPPIAAAPPTHLLYLHGFRSSPQSAKARITQRWLAAQAPQVLWACPQLPPSPAAGWALLRGLIAGWPAASMAVVGSSLGGWYATLVAEATGCRAVLLNPAVNPARDLAAHIGQQTPWHRPEEAFYFRAEYVDELRALTPAAITRPERYSGVFAQGDEVLDWREMAARYAGAVLRIVPGGDHALSDYEHAHLPWVMAQLGLPGLLRQSAA